MPVAIYWNSCLVPSSQMPGLLCAVADLEFQFFISDGATKDQKIKPFLSHNLQPHQAMQPPY